MSRNLIFLLFTNFLLAQCWQLTLSAPTAESTQPQISAEVELLNSIDSAEIAAQLTPRIRLLAHIVRKTSPLFAPVIDSGALFESVLWKSKKKQQPITSFESVLTAYAEKVNKLLRRDDKLQNALALNSQFMDTELGRQLTAEILVKFLEATSDYADIVEQYNAMAQQLDPEDAPLKARLDNSGFPQKAVYFGETFSRLQPQILAALERYFAALSAAEYAQESRMIDWYKQLKGAAVPKVQTFVKFSEFFSVQEICTVAKYYKNK